MTWQDRIKVHPAADFPSMADAELDELGRDILEHGLQQPIVTFCEKARRSGRGLVPDGEIVVLDGCSRLTAMERVGIELFNEAGNLSPEVEAPDAPVLLVFGERPFDKNETEWVTDTDPYAYVISANLHRRHLTREQKRELIEKPLKAQPKRSDRSIAKKTGSNRTTVGQIRADLEKTGEVSIIDTRTGVDGVAQPARKIAANVRRISQDEFAAIRAEAPNEAAPLTIDQLADRKDALRALDETIRLLSQHSDEVLALPRSVRLGRAMAVIDALGIGINDLVPPGRRQ
jgi:hypothetical protein